MERLLELDISSSAIIFITSMAAAEEQENTWELFLINFSSSSQPSSTHRSPF